MKQTSANKQRRPFGTWPSPITADIVAGKTPRIAEPLIQGERVYWLQSVPEEKGRITIMLHEHGRSRSVLPEPFSVRSRVHEYGGGSYCADNNQVYFVSSDDQQIYRLPMKTGAVPEPLTQSPECRFADLQVDARHQRLLAVCEDHQPVHAGTAKEPQNRLVAVPLAGESTLQTLAEGKDFYSNPRLSADGTHLCWLSWNHPDMPWDSTELWLATLNENGMPAKASRIAGGEKEALFQPTWSPTGQLYFVSDRDDWWNIYRYCDRQDTTDDNRIQPVTQLRAEFATPQWVFGMKTFGFLSGDTLFACYTRDGRWYALSLKLNGELPLTETSLFSCDLGPVNDQFSQIEGVVCQGDTAAFVGANAASLPNVHLWNQRETRLTHLNPLPSPVDREEVSFPQAFSFVSGGEQAHAFYYAPTNANYECDTGKPPLITLCHGGPTGATATGFNPKIQYWTSRGFAVVDVNYRGSTGYGRPYRQRLRGNWGITDVEDVCEARNHAVAEGWADPQRTVIKGSSAGGYTVLAALAFRDEFNAGVSLYGIGDLETLARDTHKFEARYLDSLVGPYPDEREEYIRRSPIHSADRIRCPLLVFQGLEDRVVPPNQAEDMVAKVRDNQVDVTYVTYADEGHGFRNPDNIRHMLDSELRFYEHTFQLGQQN